MDEHPHPPERTPVSPQEVADIHPAHLFQLLFVEAPQDDPAEADPALGQVAAPLAEHRVQQLLSALEKRGTTTPVKPVSVSGTTGPSERKER